MDARNPGEDFDVGKKNLQNLLGNGSSGHTANRLARRGASPTLPVSDAVFRLVGEISVRGAEVSLHLAVGLWAGIGVRNKNRNRRAQRDAAKHAGKNLASVLLLSRSDDVALPWAATVEIGLDIRLAEREARRASINHNTHSTAVRLAPGGDTK